MQIEVDPENTKYCTVDGMPLTRDKTELVIVPGGLTRNCVTIPSTVTRMGVGCNIHASLLEVTVPDDSIRRSAFHDCGNIELIPGKVRFIGEAAFDSCAKLKKVLYCNNVDCPSFEGDPFPIS